MLTVKNIKKSFGLAQGNLTVLNDISFNANNGDFIAVTGPSGIGKTTLLLIIGTLLKPDEGQILLDNVEPYKLSETERANFRADNIGFVFQQFHLMPYLNVLENILLPVIVKQNNKDTAEIYQRAETLIDELGLTKRIYHLPEQLSVGEKQRVALIRALLRNPDLILADEPTGNLDQDNTNIVISKLKEFAKQEGIVILATHDTDIAKLADKQLSLQHSLRN